MLLVNPRRVTFAGVLWDDVAAIIIDRAAKRAAVEWSDFGPHPVFADVPEQQVTIRVLQHVARDDVGLPRPGDEGVLTFHTSPAGADMPRTRVSAACVALDVTHELSLRNGALRTIKLVALSPDGAADPITTEPADGVS